MTSSSQEQIRRLHAARRSAPPWAHRGEGPGLPPAQRGLVQSPSLLTTAVFRAGPGTDRPCAFGCVSPSGDKRPLLLELPGRVGAGYRGQGCVLSRAAPRGEATRPSAWPLGEHPHPRQQGRGAQRLTTPPQLPKPGAASRGQDPRAPGRKGGKLQGRAQGQVWPTSTALPQAVQLWSNYRISLCLGFPS